jgi:hypothetical protein
MNEIPTFENIIKTELTKFDAVIPAINELSNEFMPLKIISIDDKDGYEKVSKALRFMVSKRVAVEDKRKELKADSLAFGRAVDGRAKEITSMLHPIEEHLKNEKQKIDDYHEMIKIKEEEEKKAKLDKRNKRLNEVGMFVVGSNYLYGGINTDICLPTINLEIYSDADFDAFINETDKYHQEQKRIFIENEKIKQEVNNLKKERATFRNSTLMNMGLGLVSFNDYWIYFPDRENSMQYVNIISYKDVENMDADSWENRLIEIKNKIAESDEIHKKNVDKLLQDAIIKKEQAEKEEELNLSDKEKFNSYINKLIALPKPVMSTKKWSNYVDAVIKSIDAFTKI